MAKLDAARVGIFDRAVKPYLNKLAILFGKKDTKGLVELLGGHATVVLLKSGKVYQGEEQLLEFWKELAASGVTSVCFDVQKKIAEPADFLLGAVGANGVYTRYDMTHYSFGTYEFAGMRANPGSFANKGSFVIVNGHPITCQRDALMLALDC